MRKKTAASRSGSSVKKSDHDTYDLKALPKHTVRDLWVAEGLCEILDSGVGNADAVHDEKLRDILSGISGSRTPDSTLSRAAGMRRDTTLSKSGTSSFSSGNSADHDKLAGVHQLIVDDPIQHSWVMQLDELQAARKTVHAEMVAKKRPKSPLRAFCDQCRIRRGFTESAWFESLVYFAIISNTIVLGIEVDHQDDKGTAERLFYIIECGFLVIFSLEFICKVADQGCQYFARMGNLLDFILVVIGVFNAAVIEPVFQNQNFTSRSSMLRVLRLVRVLRILNLVPAFKDLFLLMQGLMASCKTILWVGLLLLMLVYVFAVFCTQLIGHKDASIYPNRSKEIDTTFNNYEFFGTVTRSMVTLFNVLILTGWQDVTHAILEKQAYMFPFFIVFIFFTTFGVANVVVGVIVESTLTSVEALNRDMKQKHNFDHLDKFQALHRKMFKPSRAEEDTLQSIGRKEFFDLWKAEPKLPKMFADILTLPLLCGPDEVFDLLDRDGDGKITAPELLLGVFRMCDHDILQSNIMGAIEIHRVHRRLVKVSSQIDDAGRTLETRIEGALRKATGTMNRETAGAVQTLIQPDLDRIQDVLQSIVLANKRQERLLKESEAGEKKLSTEIYAVEATMERSRSKEAAEDGAKAGEKEKEDLGQQFATAFGKLEESIESRLKDLQVQQAKELLKYSPLLEGAAMEPKEAKMSEPTRREIALQPPLEGCPSEPPRVATGGVAEALEAGRRDRQRAFDYNSLGPAGASEANKGAVATAGSLYADSPRTMVMSERDRPSTGASSVASNSMRPLDEGTTRPPPATNWGFRARLAGDVADSGTAGPTPAYTSRSWASDVPPAAAAAARRYGASLQARNDSRASTQLRSDSRSSQVQPRENSRLGSSRRSPSDSGDELTMSNGSRDMMPRAPPGGGRRGCPNQADGLMSCLNSRGDSRSRQASPRLSEVGAHEI